MCVCIPLILISNLVFTEIQPDSRADLPVREGLVVWLDAQQQAKAYADHQLDSLVPGSPLGIVFDSSGNGLTFLQRSLDNKPILLPVGEHLVLRFDGKDDYLEFVGPARQLDDFTVFLLARPRSNLGGFRGLFATNQLGRKDYNSGLTIDLHAFDSSTFELLNIEGRGFTGAVDLLQTSFDFETFHLIEVSSRRGESVVLTVNGSPQGERRREDEPIAVDQMTLGARFYTNEHVPSFVRGFFDGEIAELVVYDRILTPSDHDIVAAHLHAKQLQLNAAAEGKAGRFLIPEIDPPEVQVLVPGFQVRRLPLDLPNINNLRYRPDGKLLAVAYNGDILLLSDSDADGLEDHVETFWKNDGQIRSPIGAALTPPNYPHGQGLFIASKGRVSLIADTDGDDRTDHVKVVAQGWTELPHGVDALGVAVGPDGSVYFGLGTTNFTNAYLVDDNGQAQYSLEDERGTIVRIHPDLNTREIVCTGIRFPVGLAFNRAGDLFATDQEGATWLPNGNPFDELLHIRKGRHYGFPPRHPKHLPNVVDEPSVFDYGPQHQSTCGLWFNEPAPGGEKSFGPAAWQGDALVSGYSRGKLYRTKLIKTDAGYVARNRILAQLQALTVDSSVTPRGELLVATHSGAPDWGTGPTGKGTLYQLRHHRPEEPQPALVYPVSANEVCIAYDRPLELTELHNAVERIRIEYGVHVRAADTLETLRPGYAVVGEQMRTLRYPLAVHSVAVTPDRRNLLINTAAQMADAHYAVTIETDPGSEDGSSPYAIAQLPRVDLDYDLSGLLAHWKDASGAVQWTGWLPHLDLAVCKELTRNSSLHQTLWQLIEGEGELEIRTRVKLDWMLRPRVQPGSDPGYELPKEVLTLHLHASHPFICNADDKLLTARQTSSRFSVRHRCESESFPLTVTLSTGSGLSFGATFSTADDETPRPLSLDRCVVPWARDIDESPAEPAEPVAIESWLAGRRLFFGEKASCSKCHSRNGEGGRIGPNLSNLVHRDQVSVLRDIQQPNAAINPDFISYQIALANGDVVTGPVQSSGNQLRIGTAEGKELVVDQSDVELMQPARISVMPEDIAKKLTQPELDNLLAFLLHQPPEELRPAPITREGAPPARSYEEVQKLIGSVPTDAQNLPPLHVALISGPKDHGINEHDYPDWLKRWKTLLELADNVTVTTEEVWPSAETLESADVLVWYSANPGWRAERAKDLDAFQARGGGMVYLHYSVNGQSAPEQLAQRIGLAWKGGQSKFRHGALDLEFRSTSGNPIVEGFSKLHFVDESYWQLTGEPQRVTILATGQEEGAPQPLMWTYERDKGRVFVSILGHYSWTFDDPLFRLLVLRGICWTAKQPVNRLNELAPIGARFKEPGSNE